MVFFSREKYTIHQTINNTNLFRLSHLSSFTLHSPLLSHLIPLSCLFHSLYFKRTIQTNYYNSEANNIHNKKWPLLPPHKNYSTLPSNGPLEAGLCLLLKTLSSPKTDPSSSPPNSSMATKTTITTYTAYVPPLHWGVSFMDINTKSKIMDRCFGKWDTPFLGREGSWLWRVCLLGWGWLVRQLPRCRFPWSM
mmetsp:Transcript_7785/g.14678  ORF Transcript_7785/g.14678 Transcript_7785/m.14678 type:complete len:193 (+) Transcript_7785:2215-2793(+)